MLLIEHINDEYIDRKSGAQVLIHSKTHRSQRDRALHE